MTSFLRATLLCACRELGACAPAAVGADEASQLGRTLTPWGDDKAGNAEGTIPAYTDGQIKPPAGFDAKNPRARPDPFADEKPLYSVTAAQSGAACRQAQRRREGASAKGTRA
jgi:hypothetical protein